MIIAFENLKNNEVKDLCKKSLIETSKTVFESGYVWKKLPGKDLPQTLVVEGFEDVIKSIDKGDGLILFTPHHANIEILINFLGKKIDCSVPFSKIKNKPLFVFHTFLIWTCYFLMFYFVKFSINETAQLEFEALILAFIAGAITMSLTNGGIGAYPIAIAVVISQYNVSYENALALGWIVWSAQTLMIIFFGILSFIFLPILNK